MIYLLLLIGLVLIYLSLRFNSPSDRKNSFNRVLQNNIDIKELENLSEQLKDFSDRMDNLEASLLLIAEEFHNDVNENIYKDDNNVNEMYKKNVELESQSIGDLSSIETDNLGTILKVDTLESLETDSKTLLNNRIYTLFDEGKTIDEISSITRVGKGEILLRLGLRKQKQ